MLAIATTMATVSTRPELDDDDQDAARDDHGALLPVAPVVSEPWAAHRAPFSARVRGATKMGADDQQTTLATWYLEPAAWPVHVGDEIADQMDGTRWSVSTADLVPSGLGLQQVMAACSRLDVSAN